MSLNLKHIMCPRGEDCTAFKCVFRHPNEVLEAEEPAPAPAPASDPLKRPRPDAEAPSQEEVQKRLKVSPSSGKPSQRGLESIEPTGRSSEGQSPTASIGASKISPVKPVRLNQAANSAASAAASGLSSAVDRANVPFSKAPSGKVPSKAEPETLNPRLLANCPASHQTRTKLLKMLHSEYSRLNTELAKDVKSDDRKLVLSSSELITKALDDEQTVCTEKSAVYANVMKNTVMQYKRMKVAEWRLQREKETKSATDATEKKHEKISTGLSTAQEVAMLKYVLTPITDLANHGYVAKVPTDEAIEEMRKALVAAKGWEKCDRCLQRFQVFPGRREEDGALTTGGACRFHWGKRYIPAKAAGDTSRPPKRFQCCGEEEGESKGCLTHECHVFKAVNATRLATLSNFVATPPNDDAPADRAVCFDCEMGYTVYGMELVRLTATSWPDGERLLDVLVQPKGEVLDLNSRFSGVWPDDLALAELWTSPEIPPLPEIGEESKLKLKKVASPEVARDLLFSQISPETPLIGHGLENDLNAVRIVHPTVIDTVLLYPHRAGLPYRYALKTLMLDKLNRKIQQETGPKMLGHDSAEDARAAGDLVLLKIKEMWREMKERGWTFDGIDSDPRAGPWLKGPQGQGEGGVLTEALIEEVREVVEKVSHEGPGQKAILDGG